MILAYHGSPGLPDDYLSLSSALQKTDGVPGLKSIVRAGYPGAREEREKGSVYLGYSFGCVQCVDDAAKNQEAKAVILVSPYLFPMKKPGIMGAILMTPGLGDLLLEKLGPGSMKKLAIKSCLPALPPESYLNAAARYATPEILRTAIKETTQSAPSVPENLRTLKNRGVKLLVIWSKLDETSRESEQIVPIRNILPNLQEVSLDSAGHALIFTHPELLAEKIQTFIAGESQ